MLNIWGKALDETLLSQIVAAANGAPVAAFERVVMAKFKGSRKTHTTGLLVELAKDAHRAHEAERIETWGRLAAEARQRPTADEERELQARLDAEMKKPISGKQAAR